MAPVLAPSGIPSGLASLAVLVSRLRVASIVVGPSGPYLRLGAAHVFGPSGIPTVSAFCPHQRLCAASVLGPSRIPSPSARQNFERVCGLSRVKPEHGVFSG